MGAGNSTPQTERIDNPTRIVPMQVTPSVVTRLEAEQKRQNDCDRNNAKSEGKEDQSQKQQTSPGWSHDQEMFYKNYVELEQNHFDRAFEKLENLVDTPVLWVKDVDEEIKVLRRDLIECYRDYPGQTLYCSDLAKKYQDFIFREQYKSILKFNEKLGESTHQSIPPEPHQHSPPYT